MRVRCINPRFRHIHFVTDATGAKTAKPIKEGDEFEVAGIPPSWKGFVIPVDGDERVTITNPAQPEEVEALKQEYREITGKPAHYTWDEDRLREKIAEAKGDQ